MVDNRRNGAAGDLEPALRERIGRGIRAVYDGVAREPVPDRFLDLLDALSKSEKRAATEADGREDRP